jgi:ribosomal protein L11 methyltransferase
VQERWLELSVEVDVEAVEAVSEILGRVAVGTAVRPTRLIRDPNDELAVRDDPAGSYVVSAHVPDDAGAPASVEQTERALWHLQAFALRPVGALRVRAVRDDWTDAWRQHYAPQRIGRVLIVPSWVAESPRTGEVAIRMDPGMAFGTGLHPTTRGCLMLLQDVEPMPTRVLDVGCGSGILALAALSLGTDAALAIDTDPLAVDATRANAALNGMAGRIETRHGTLAAIAEQPFRLVLANLVATLLVEMAPRLAAHTAAGGTLVAGGIIAARGEEVRSALEAAGFAVRRTIDDGEWLSLRLERAADTRHR